MSAHPIDPTDLVRATVVQRIRLRFQEVRTAHAPLAAWRELQLEILDAVRIIRRDAATRAHTVGATSHDALWSMLGDAFWLERDVTRLSHMLEDVVAELERAVHDQ